MVWIPIAAWGAAVLIAVVVLGFAGYELRWKSARLRADMARLVVLGESVQQLQGELAAAQERLSRAGTA